jgi:hypothetical protein
MPDRDAAPSDDPLLDRTRELAEARATIAHLQAENDALRARSLAPLPPDLPARALLPPAAHLSPPTAYRGEDPLLRLDRELSEANLQLVNLGMDNAILRNRADSDPRRDARLRTFRRAGTAVAITAGSGLLWFVTGHAVILLPAGILLVMLWGLLRLIDTIKPSDPGSRPPPPALPPGMGGL